MKNLLKFLSILFLFASCVSPQASFEKGNYNTAFKTSLRKVKKQKATDQEHSIMMESLRILLSENRAKIDRLNSSATPKHWKEALDVIANSRKKIRKVENVADYDFSIIENDLSVTAGTITNDLYHFYYDSGVEKLEYSILENDKFEAQEAYRMFSNARAYTSLPQDVDSLMERCVAYGKVYYSLDVSMPYFYGSNVWMNDSRLAQNSRFRSVSFNRNPGKDDGHVSVDFGQINVYENERCTFSQSYSRQVEIGVRFERDTAGNQIRIPIFETVRGEVRIYTLEKKARGDVRINVRAFSKNCSLSNRYFTNEATASIERVETSGDVRAIPNQYLNRSGFNQIRNDSDLADDVLKGLYDKVYCYF